MIFDLHYDGHTETTQSLRDATLTSLPMVSLTLSGPVRTTALSSRASASRAGGAVVRTPAVPVPKAPRRPTVFQCRASGEIEVEFSLPDGGSKTVGSHPLQRLMALACLPPLQRSLIIMSSLPLDPR